MAICQMAKSLALYYSCKFYDEDSSSFGYPLDLILTN